MKPASMDPITWRRRTCRMGACLLLVESVAAAVVKGVLIFSHICYCICLYLGSETAATSRVGAEVELTLPMPVVFKVSRRTMNVGKREREVGVDWVRIRLNQIPHGAATPWLSLWAHVKRNQTPCRIDLQRSSCFPTAKGRALPESSYKRSDSTTLRALGVKAFTFLICPPCC